MSFWIQMGLNDAASPHQLGLIVFHDHCYFVLSMVLVGLLHYMGFLLHNDLYARYIYEHSKLEFSWTTFPIVVLTFLIIPSLILLYSMDEATLMSSVTVKVVGHQWYWEYQMMSGRGEPVSYNSYMVRPENLEPGEPRNLSTDQPLIIPCDENIRLLGTSADVLHCFSAPRLGVKFDTVPGRLNVVHVRVEEPGTFYGQCSELCGSGHSFMPIQVTSVPLEEYMDCISSVKKLESVPQETSAAQSTAEVTMEVEDDLEAEQEVLREILRVLVTFTLWAIFFLP